MTKWMAAVLALTMFGCKVDTDGDGFSCDVDCNDMDASIFPGADEVCDGIDNNCSGEADDNATDMATWYADADNDGFGNTESTEMACSAPEGFVADATDCDDTNDLRFPGNSEVCDEVDNDCNDLVDDDATDAPTWYADTDGDTFGDPDVSEVACEAPAETVSNSEDCDDTEELRFPGNPEVCDELDNDCNDLVDDEATDAATYYSDVDEDGLGDPDTLETTCDTPPAESVSNGDDCNDGYDEIGVCNTIYDIQGETLSDGSTVVVDRAVVTGVSPYGVFVQDPTGGEYSGIWCYTGSGATHSLSVGDMASVSGEYIEYSGLSEIDMSTTGWVINHGATTPLTAEVVPTSDLIDPSIAEGWEGVLISVENVSVVDPDLGFGEWQITDGVRIDDIMYNVSTDYPSLAAADAFDSITGTLHFSFGEYKIEPRDSDDLTGYAPAE